MAKDTPFLDVQKLTKSYGALLLFKDICFSVAEGQRVGLIAKNGTGKSTLLSVLAGKEGYDSGEIIFRRDIKVGYLEQSPVFDPEESVLDACFNHRGEEAMVLKAKQVLTRLNIRDLSQPMGQLSGGQQKRVALANVLLTEPDMLILDEPTNHLDLEMIEWLEGYLAGGNKTLLMVTHDRFFLDREKFAKDAENADMIIFCSPQNPSGIVFTEEELRFVLETAKKHDITVISDEIHSDLVHPNAKHIPMGLVNERVGAKCITLFAPSKTFNIAGEHIAFAVFSHSEMETAFREAESALWLDEPGITGGELAYAAYTKGGEYNKALCRYLGETAEAMRKYLADNCPGLKMANGDASFVTFIDCSEYYQRIEAEVLGHPDRYQGGEGGGILSRFFGVNAGVAMNDGTWFGSDWYGFVRFNYGTSRGRVMKALERIVRAVKSL